MSGKMESFKPVRLAYNTFESASGTDENLSPVIFLHGLSAAKEYWHEIPQNVSNATKRRSYALDARNHGDSEWSDLFNFDVNSEDLIHFLDTMGIRKAILVGHSMGGVTSIKTALKRPDRVECIIVEDMKVRKFSTHMVKIMPSMLMMVKKAVEQVPPGLSADETKKSIQEYFLANMSPEAVEFMKKGGQTPKFEFDMNHLRRDTEGRCHMRCNVDAILKSISNSETLDSEPEGVFEGPALFIYGSLSPIKVGEDLEHIKQFFPKVVFEEFEADHSIHVPEPAKFTESILKFIS